MQEQINTGRMSEAGRAELLPYTDTDVNNHEITLPIKKGSQTAQLLKLFFYTSTLRFLPYH